MEHIRTPDIYYKIPIDTVTLSTVLFKPITLHIICLTDFNILTRNESAVDTH
jgi:hypothetical protein